MTDWSFHVLFFFKTCTLGLQKTPTTIKATVCPSVVSHSPGRNPEVLLDEVTGDGKWQQGDEEYGGHIGDDTQGGHTQQGGAGEAFQRGGDVLVNRVCVCGKPVEDAAEGSRLKQPENSDGWVRM